MAAFNSRLSSLIFRRVVPSLRHPGASKGALLPQCPPGNAHAHRHTPARPHSSEYTRALYTQAALGLDQYTQMRQDTRARFGAGVDSFKDKMKEILEKNASLIFTEDFKNVLHLVEGSEEDMQLVRSMAVRFNKQHEGLRFGMYVFGPVVMRTYHTLGQTDAMVEALNDPQLDGFFDQLTSYQLAMDQLFEAAQYQLLVDLFETVQEKRVGGVRFPKNCLTLAFAACYRMGTQDSFQHLQELLQKVKDYGIPLNRRLVVFGAALSLSVGRPDAALELVLASPSATHIAVRSIKVVSLCQLGRVEEAMVALRAITEIDLPGPQRSNQGKYILRQAVIEVEEKVEEEGRKEQQTEFSRILKCLEEAKAISEKTLDEVVCQKIDKFERRSGQDKAILAASFNTRTHTRTHAHAHAHRQHRRQGLMDYE